MDKDKENYKYTPEEKDMFLKIYHSSVKNLIVKMNEVHGEISQVSISGSSNVHLMNNAFKFMIEIFSGYNNLNEIFNKIINDEYSEELFEIFEKVKEETK